MIWLNMASTLGALGPDVASGVDCGTKRREKDMTAQKKKRDGKCVKKNGQG